MMVITPQTQVPPPQMTVHFAPTKSSAENDSIISQGIFTDSSMSGRADAVTDLDEGAAPSDPTQGPAEGPTPDASAPNTPPGPDQNGAAEADEGSSFARKDGEAANAYARRIFERVFGHDIERVLRMEVKHTDNMSRPLNVSWL